MHYLEHQYFDMRLCALRDFGLTNINSYMHMNKIWNGGTFHSQRFLPISLYKFNVIEDACF
jgi:hypothetical protein